MKEPYIRNSNGNDAFDAASKPRCYDPRCQQATVGSSFGSPDAAEAENEEGEGIYRSSTVFDGEWDPQKI